MLKVKIYSVGKTKKDWLSQALEVYETRLISSLTFEWILAKNDEQLKQFLAKEPIFFCLAPQGRQYSSEEFSLFFTKSLQENCSRLVICIGGSEGIPLQIKSKAKQLISLSKMTFTHQITRLILVEQIYRALEIQKGSIYHK